MMMIVSTICLGTEVSCLGYSDPFLSVGAPVSRH